MNVGQTLRTLRLQKGYSQGDIEKHTGLLRCYLSRVENGHTVPSLGTLTKIAEALDLSLSRFFEDELKVEAVERETFDKREVKFLKQIRRYSTDLTDQDRSLLLAMVRKFSETTERQLPEVQGRSGRI